MKYRYCLYILLLCCRISIAQICFHEASKTIELDWLLLKEKNYYGYTKAEIKKYFDYPLTLHFNFKGLDTTKIKPIPKAGIHPRIYFYQEDLPALREKLSTTPIGKMVINEIRKTVYQFLTGTNAVFKTDYELACNGNMTASFQKNEFTGAIFYEIFKSLIDNDSTNAQKAIAAMTTFVKADAENVANQFKAYDTKFGKPLFRDYMATKHLCFSNTIGENTNLQGGLQLVALAYDLAFNWMTNEQKNIFRQYIAMNSQNHTVMGCLSLPSLTSNSSYWNLHNLNAILFSLAIEGEEGYDAATFERYIQGLKKYYALGLYTEGDMYEAMGKASLYLENIAPLTSRNVHLIALTNIQQQIRNYFLHSKEPNAATFTFYDANAGTGNKLPPFDILILKYFYPKDATIDFIYRNMVGEDYAFFREGFKSHPNFVHSLFLRAIFGIPYDTSKTYSQAQTTATNQKPLTFYSNHTGVMITRNHWGNNATVLHAMNKSISGGHTFADKGNFNIYALGRNFAIYKNLRLIKEHYEPRHRSTILIDGVGVSTVPSQSVKMIDNQYASFNAVNLKTCFDYKTSNNRLLDKKIPLSLTLNDFIYKKSTIPYYKLPYAHLPNWQTSEKGLDWWEPHFSVKRAFRTTGMVRGKHTYLLVIDDVQKDNNPHNYQFGVIIENDLIAKSTIYDNKTSNFKNDIIMGAKNKPENMLIRVLQLQNEYDSFPGQIASYLLPNAGQKDILINKLTIHSKAISPEFKILFFPFIEGEQLPNTTWSKSKKVLTIAWPEQIDELTFGKTREGRTTLKITRAGKLITAVL